MCNLGVLFGGQEGCGKWTLECAICVIAFASILELAKALPAIFAVVESKVNDHQTGSHRVAATGGCHRVPGGQPPVAAQPARATRWLPNSF